MDNAQGWKAPVDRSCTRLQQRMYFLAHGVEEKSIKSILRRGTAVWYSNLTVESGCTYRVPDCASGSDSYGDHGGQKPSTPPSDNNLRVIS